jgi:glycosyltransferase involved in cell wall biosynthesis
MEKPGHSREPEFGLNVIGYGFVESGVGEDARSAICSCIANDIPAALINVPLANLSRQNNFEYRHLEIPSPRYGASLFCLPPPELFRIQLSMPPSTFDGRRIISAPPWELPHWPGPLRYLADCVDEFWAPSSFIGNMLTEFTRKPVHVVPLAVRLDRREPKDRDYFGLPRDVYLFMFVFDWISWPQRKNPEAVLKAFSAAFKNDKDVGLVIKTMNTKNNKQALTSMLKKYGMDSNIYVLDKVMSATEIASLYTCADAYVSLHRSEGFGRTIAEAMLSEVPVIVTNYSGNRDFCTDETSFLIDGRLVALKEGDYLFPKGQSWCEPDHDQAVEMLRLCHRNRSLAKAKAEAGKRMIEERCSPSSVGQLYRRLLENAR